MRLLTVIMALQISVLRVITSPQANAQTPAQAAQAPPESLLEQIKKAVVFLQGDYTVPQPRVVNGTQQLVAMPAHLYGTGFLIFIPDSRLGPDKGETFLVTNKHMIREPGPNGASGEGPYFRGLAMRINTRQVSADGTQFSLTPLEVVNEQGSLAWFVDADENVDLAITPIVLNDKQLDFKTIQQDLFATKEALTREQVSENDEILFAGLFAWSPGVKKNLPIIRHGKLARRLEEPIPLDRNHPNSTVQVHLAEVLSFGGNSGSPVFLRLGGVREGSIGPALSGYNYYLLGVMQGFFPEGMDFAIQIAELRGSAAQNSGLAAVIPAEKIMEVLDEPRGRAYRELVVAISMTNQGSSLEAEKLYKDAIQILEQSCPLHAELAAALQAYAGFLRKVKRMGEAGPLEEHAHQILANVTTDRMHPRN